MVKLDKRHETITAGQTDLPFCFCECKFRYPLGETPAYCLKYLRKVNCSGKFSSAAICLNKRYGRDTNLISLNKSNIDFLSKYLATGEIETVLAGGENYLGSRPLHYEWVKSLNEQCRTADVHLIFGQTGNIFIKDGKEYKIRNRTEQMIQALKSGVHYPEVDIAAEIAKIMERKERMKALRSRKCEE